jgi:hypothetical protein
MNIRAKVFDGVVLIIIRVATLNPYPNTKRLFGNRTLPISTTAQPSEQRSRDTETAFFRCCHNAQTEYTVAAFQRGSDPVINNTEY